METTHETPEDAVAELAYHDFITPADFTDDGIRWVLTPLGRAYFDEVYTVDSVLTLLALAECGALK